MKTISLVFLLMALSFVQVKAQNLVEGIVLDENMEPVFGATVLENGTTNGVLTDMDGSFSLSVADSATIVISYVGYKSKEFNVIGDMKQLIFNLEMGITLQEVVVLGYQRKSREEVTGSVSVIDIEEIDQMPIANIDNLLQGKAAGLVIQSGSGQPGSNGTSVNIRGITSIDGNTDPYYLMDGVPINAADFSAINPNDIESISVLKDASASIYGAQAANGVIIITTKKGSAGATKIDLRTQFGVSMRPQDNIDLMNTEQLLSFENYLASQSSGGGLGGIYGPDGTAPNPLLYDSLRGINTNYEDVILRKGLSQSYELTISGGTDELRFYVSGNYFDQQGIVENSDFKRGTLRLNLNGDKGKLTYDIGLNTGYSKSSLPSTFTNGGTTASGDGDIYQNPISGIYWGIPYEKLILQDGSFASLIGAGGDNWLDQFENWEQTEVNLKLIGRARLSYEAYKGLEIATSLGMDFSQLNTKELVPPTSLFGTVVLGNSGRLQNLTSESKDYVVTTTANYRDYIRSKHLLDVIIGNEIIYDEGRGFGYAAYSLNPKDLSGDAVDESQTTPSVSGEFSSESLVSLFFNGGYTFDDRYSISGGFRRDAASVFGANNQWANFWNIGTAWVLTNESFLKGQRNVNYLKIRLSYGTLGNSGISRTSKFTAYVPTSYNGNTGQVPSTVGDPDVRWEETRTANLGVDFEFLRNRIRGSIDIYNKKTSGFFQDVDISMTTGFSELTRNAGEMRNRGVEIITEFDFYRHKKTRLTFRTNYAYNQNVVLSLQGGNQFEIGTLLVEEGRPYGLHYAVPYLGIDPATGAPLFRDLEGNVTTSFNINNRTTDHGSYLPVHTGSFGLNVSIQNFYAIIDFNFMTGHSVFNLQLPQYSYDIGSIGIQNFFTDMLDIWREPGQVTNIQGVVGGSALNSTESSRYIEDGSFLKLKNIRVGYRFTNFAKGFRHINIYAQGQNLYFWSAITGADPETWNNVSFYRYPNPRIVTFGFDFGI